MSLDLKELIEQFLEKAKPDTRFLRYTEPTGLEEKLELFLREQLHEPQYGIEKQKDIGAIETPVDTKFAKKYMDIYIRHEEAHERYCIELKCPSSDAFPRRIFQAFQDVNFLEELRFKAEFSQVALLFLTSSGVYMDGPRKKKEGIYRYFRQETRICPVDESELSPSILDEYGPLSIQGNYPFKWKRFGDEHHYFVIVF